MSEEKHSWCIAVLYEGGSRRTLESTSTDMSAYEVIGGLCVSSALVKRIAIFRDGEHVRTLFASSVPYQADVQAKEQVE